jgi:hypothetical protein
MTGHYRTGSQIQGSRLLQELAHRGQGSDPGTPTEAGGQEYGHGSLQGSRWLWELEHKGRGFGHGAADDAGHLSTNPEQPVLQGTEPPEGSPIQGRAR